MKEFLKPDKAKRRKSWMTEDMLDPMEQRRILKRIKRNIERCKHRSGGRLMKPKKGSSREINRSKNATSQV